MLLQNGAVVGSDGFGFAREANGRWYKIRQAGGAVLGDDVEVQAHAAIDRATVGETRIGRGTKIDNLVQVGHACKVGEDTLLCGQVGLAGSTTVGDRCILAGQVGAAGHMTIGDGATISSQSGVPGDVPAGAVYSGYPAMDNLAWRKSVAVFNRLPELQVEIRELRAEVDPPPRGQVGAGHYPTNSWLRAHHCASVWVSRRKPGRPGTARAEGQSRCCWRGATHAANAVIPNWMIYRKAKT